MPNSICCTGGEVWLEHGYFSDRQDLQATAPGQQYLQKYGLGEFEVVGESQMYHSPASLIEGGPCFCAAALHVASVLSCTSCCCHCCCCCCGYASDSLHVGPPHG